MLTLPDRSNDTNPLNVIDPSGVKDSTAGINQFLNDAPTGASILNPYTLRISSTVTVPDTKTFRGGKLFKGEMLPWRVVVDIATNPNGRAAEWLYDLQGGSANEFASIVNPYGLDANGNEIANGSGVGGFNGTTEWPPVAYGGHYDGLHFKALQGAPFKNLRPAPGDAMQVQIGGGIDGVYNKTIKSVSDDGTTVYFYDTVDVVHTNSSGTSSWCITRKGASWIIEFGPNPTYQRSTITSTSWDGFTKALAKCMARNVLPMVRVGVNATLLGMIVYGANRTVHTSLSNWTASRPVVNENQHNVATSDPSSRVIFCDIGYSWGDAESGPGQLIANYMHDTGRMGHTVTANGKRIYACTMENHKHHSIDIEATHPWSDLHIDSCIFGGTPSTAKSAIALTSRIDGLTATNNRSTQADVDAGTIRYLSASLFAAARGGGSNWVVSGNKFSFPIPAGAEHAHDAAYAIGGVNGLVMHDNVEPTGGFFLQPWTKADKSDRCTNVDVSGNDGGPLCQGQVAA